MEIKEKEFLEYIKPILDNKEFQMRKTYMHHEGVTVYEHSLRVSYIAYKMAKKRKVDVKSTVIGALLHDFYYKPWQEKHEKVPFFKMHGFVHAKEALENSKKNFPELMNPIVENCIERHMFPLNITPPKYKESWIVTMADKKDSLEVLKHPTQYPKYLGLSNIFKRKKK